MRGAYSTVSGFQTFTKGINKIEAGVVIEHIKHITYRFDVFSREFSVTRATTSSQEGQCLMATYSFCINVINNIYELLIIKKDRRCQNFINFKRKLYIKLKKLLSK